MKRVLRCAMLSVLLGTAVFSCAAPKQNLREMAVKGMDLIYHVKAGDSHTYRLRSHTVVNQEVMGQKRTYTTDTKQVFTLKVLKVQGKNIQYALKFDSLEVNSTAPMQTDLEAYKKALLNADIRIFADRKGNASKVTGLEGLKKMSLASRTESQLKNLLLTFPDGPKKVGDFWTKTEKNSLPSGPLDIGVTTKIKTTFAGVAACDAGSCLKFDMQGDLSLAGSGNQGGVDLMYEGSGTIRAEVLFDYATGTILRMTSKQNIDGTVTIPSQAMDIPSTTRQKTTLVRIR